MRGLTPIERRLLEENLRPCRKTGVGTDFSAEEWAAANALHKRGLSAWLYCSACAAPHIEPTHTARWLLDIVRSIETGVAS